MVNDKSTGRAEGRSGDGVGELRTTLSYDAIATCAGAEIRARRDVELLTASAMLPCGNVVASRLSSASNQRSVGEPIVPCVRLAAIASAMVVDRGRAAPWNRATGAGRFDPR